MLTKRAAVVFALLFSFSLYAQDRPWSITPTHGPTSGGTTVTIKGPFGSWPYWVGFGDSGAVSVSRIDNDTLQAVTPPHLPGTVDIQIIEYDIGLENPLKFTFDGPAPEVVYERLLLPVFIPPTQGAHGAEFRTDLTLRAKPGRQATVHGLLRDCIVLCVEPPNSPVTLFPDTEMTQLNLVQNGTPGRFLLVAKGEVKNMTAHLRAFDVSREASNYGTELPVVRFDVESDELITLASVPTDPRFRNTLRIYSDVPQRVQIMAGDRNELLLLERNPADIHAPAYGVWTNFPSDVGSIPVTVMAEPIMVDPAAYAGKIWAMVTVTNNDTQAITTVTPHP